MKEMLRFLLGVIFLAPPGLADYDHYYTDDIYSGNSDLEHYDTPGYGIPMESPDKDKFHRYNEDKTVNQIHQHNQALVSLFESDDLVLKSVYRILHQVSFLRLAEVRTRISNAASDRMRMAKLNSTQQQEIQGILGLIDERMTELSRISRISFLLKELENYSSGLLSLLSTKTTFDHLSAITNAVETGAWRCSNGHFTQIWDDLRRCHESANDLTTCRPHTHQQFENAINSLVGIAEAVNNATDPGGPHFDVGGGNLRNKVMLIDVLSESKNRQFILSALGSMRDLRDLIESILCGRLSLHAVGDLLWRLRGGKISGPYHPYVNRVTDSHDLLALVEIQKAIGSITEGLTKDDRQRAPSGTHGNLVEVILDSYMDLVDDAMRATEAWSQMPLTEAEGNLHNLLVCNEQYVGMVSDVLMDGHHHRFILEKSSLSINIRHIGLSVNQSATAQFQYDDMVIETDDISYLRRGNTSEDVTVFALRYKSWSHMMLDIMHKHSEHLVRASTNHTKWPTTALPGSMSSLGSMPPFSEEYDFRYANDEKNFKMSEKKASNDGETSLELLAAFNKTFVGKGGVVSLSAYQKGEKNSIPVTYWMKFDNESDKPSMQFRSASVYCLSCEFLEVETMEWSPGGCHVIHVNRSGITCRCNHTTNFAAFMMPAEMIYATKEEKKILEIMSAVGSILSVIGLMLSLVTFALVRRVIRNDRIQAHINLSASLLVVHLLYLFGDLFLRSDQICLVATVLSHYTILAAFMWMLVEGIFLYLYVVQVFLRSKIASYYWMYVVGWLLPAVMVAISAGYGVPNDVYVMPKTKEPSIKCPDGAFLFSFEENERYDIYEAKYDRCWLSTESGMIWSFLGPALLVLVFNSFIMGKTLQVCIKSLKSATRLRILHKIVTKSTHSHCQGTSTRQACNYERQTDGQMNSEIYDHLHGQSSSRQSRDSNTMEFQPQIVISSSPCLLQVTTDDENDDAGNGSSGPFNRRLLSLPDQDIREASRRSTSSENLRSGSCGRNRSASGEVTDDVDLDAPAFNHGSMVYRNSTCMTSQKSAAIPDSVAMERKILFKEAKTAVKGAIVLLPVLGIPWVCGVLSPLSPVFAFIFVTLNSTQGLAIFIVYCVCNGEVRRAVERHVTRRQARYGVAAGLRRSSSTSTTSIRKGLLRFGRRRSTVTTTM